MRKLYCDFFIECAAQFFFEFLCSNFSSSVSVLRGRAVLIAHFLLYSFISLEMSESDLLSSEQIDGLDGLENGQEGDSIMQCDGVKRDFNEANIDDPVSGLILLYYFHVPVDFFSCSHGIISMWSRLIIEPKCIDQ